MARPKKPLVCKGGPFDGEPVDNIDEWHEGVVRLGGHAPNGEILPDHQYARYERIKGKRDLQFAGIDDLSPEPEETS